MDRKDPSRAHATLSNAKFNKQQLLPLLEDIVLLHKYINEKTVETMNSDSLTVKEIYRQLTEVCLTGLILFNRKQSDEAQRITKNNYNSILNSSEVYSK